MIALLFSITRLAKLRPPLLQERLNLQSLWKIRQSVQESRNHRGWSRSYATPQSVNIKIPEIALAFCLKHCAITSDRSKHFDAQKSIIFFSEGFLSEDLISRFQEVVDQALKAGVIFTRSAARTWRRMISTSPAQQAAYASQNELSPTMMDRPRMNRFIEWPLTPVELLPTTSMTCRAHCAKQEIIKSIMYALTYAVPRREMMTANTTRSEWKYPVRILNCLST